VTIRRTLILSTKLTLDASSAQEAEYAAVERVERSVLAWAVDDGRHWVQDLDGIEAFDVVEHQPQAEGER
jgi:hypothetical protein